MDISNEFSQVAEGTVEIITPDDLRDRLRRAKAEGRPLRIKLGIDPTASDIHLGFAVVLRKLRLFQDLGHTAVLIIGDYTAQVGDPSGRKKTRPILTHQEVEENARTYLDQVVMILREDRLEIRRNGEWFSGMSFIDIIRLASHITLARLIERDDFHLRLNEGVPVGFHELFYPLMQAYDSVAVEADVELGGTDQIFNFLLARGLQKAMGQEPQVCLTTPLIEGIDGVQKMSKSLGNYIGIAEPPGEIFGKVMSIPDPLMGKYFRFCTDLDAEAIGALLKDDRNPMGTKLRLAWEVVRIYHGEEAAGEAKEGFLRVFSRRELPEDIPVCTLSSDREDGKIWIVDILRQAGFAHSNREARNFTTSGAVFLDGQKITDADADLDLRGGEILKVGKRRFARLEIKRRAD